jgi:tRNA threonylcarbamoyladenosine biosynthesis protein TsaB
MIVLGFDTATPSTAVGLRLADGELLEARDDPPPGRHPGNTTHLLTIADQLLDRAGVAWRNVERIAVGLGPGTFTGLRVGIATARGLAQSLSVELVGVCSLRALAVGADQQIVVAVIDARRAEVFAAVYGRAAGDGPIELVEPRAVAPGKLSGMFEQSRERAGGGALRPLAVGDGATRYRDELERLGAEVPADASPLHRVQAAAICELGLRARPASELEQVVPDYRRRPDAEIALEARAVGDDGGSRALEGAGR